MPQSEPYRSLRSPAGNCARGKGGYGSYSRWITLPPPAPARQTDV